ncbi:chaperonin GroEL, partial [Candidatus Dojkabacteria bacterium]|nr:chaperonin GroEL [Candidatus Dojkabacteria bacterium]
GVVVGGGLALHNAREVLDSVKVDDADEKIGVDILRTVLSDPLKQIAENAGRDGAVVADKSKDNFGYNAKADKFEDLIKAGITDPVKVTRLALHHGASVANMIIMTEAVVTDLPEKDEPISADPGGMGMM